MKNAYGKFGIAVGVVVFGWLGIAPVESQSTPPSSGTPAMVTAGDIAGNPSRYYGQKVTVRAEVEDVLSRQVFLLDEDKLFAWPDLLVITPALSSMIPEDEIVTVVGTVRAFVDADFRRDYDWNWWGDADVDIFVTFRDRPVLVADSVKTRSGMELVKK